MIRRWLLPFCMMLAPTHAGAGVRAAYSNGWGSPLEVAIDDRGNASIRYDEARRIIVANGETHIVEERLTGPVVIRAEDLDALLPPPRNDPGETLRQLGTREVDGRSGTAFGRPKGGGAKEDILLFVISPDPAFRPLGAAMARLLDAELLIGRWAKRPYQRDPSTLRPAIAAGAPLIFDGRRLRRLVHDDVAAAEVALPAPAMSREALAAWLKAEARARKAPAAGDTMILRAAYAGGRLWLLSQD